jgi:alpha-L-arabinofuranosidase
VQASGENEWSRLRVEHGTQRERDVIFKVLRLGWSRENIKSHIVRNNTIYDCGQTGICGHLGAVFSTTTGNHIFRIYIEVSHGPYIIDNNIFLSSLSPKTSPKAERMRTI